MKLVRDAGAAEVHLKITCPPITHACHFGVDMGHDGDLIAATLSVEEIREHIGADSLAFLSLDGMMRAIASREAGQDDGYCNACFTGQVPARRRRRPVEAVVRRRAGMTVRCIPDPSPNEPSGRSPDAGPRRRWRRPRSGHRLGVSPPRSRRDRGARSRRAPARPTSISSSPAPRRRLAAGIADECARRGLPCFGPTAELARLESSKSFARALATELGIPGPRFARFDEAPSRRRMVAASSASRSW